MSGQHGLMKEMNAVLVNLYYMAILGRGQPGLMISMNDWCCKARFYTVRLNWAVDNLG